MSATDVDPGDDAVRAFVREAEHAGLTIAHDHDALVTWVRARAGGWTYVYIGGGTDHALRLGMTEKALRAVVDRWVEAGLAVWWGEAYKKPPTWLLTTPLAPGEAPKTLGHFVAAARRAEAEAEAGAT